MNLLKYKELGNEISLNKFQEDISTRFIKEIIDNSDVGLNNFTTWYTEGKEDLAGFLLKSKSKYIINIIKNIIGERFNVTVSHSSFFSSIKISWKSESITRELDTKHLYEYAATSSFNNLWRQEKKDKYEVFCFTNFIKHTIKNKIVTESNKGSSLVFYNFWSFESFTKSVLKLEDDVIINYVKDIIGKEFDVEIERILFNSSFNLTIRWKRESLEEKPGFNEFYSFACNNSYTIYKKVENSISEVLDIYINRVISPALLKAVNNKKEVSFKLTEVHNIEGGLIGLYDGKKYKSIDKKYLEDIICLYVYESSSNEAKIERMITSKLGRGFKVKLVNDQFKYSIEVNWK